MAQENELIIGLGGVGGRCIKEFCMTRLIREDDTRRLRQKETIFELLYIDSNNDIYRADWKVYAKDVKIPNRDFIHLKGTTGISISNIAQEGNVSPWIGDLTGQFGKKTNTKSKREAEVMLQGLDGASQLRRFGRALFASQADKVRTTLRNKISSLIVGRDNKDINVRIFCTLGGGTGSGSLIDMITLVKTMARDLGCNAKICVYPFVAGAAASGQNAGSFYENEYATLRDLNALMVKKYRPHIAAGESCIPFKENNPVSQVFISSEMSPGSLPLDDQIRHIVNAYYDLVVYMSGCGGENAANAQRAITMEDLGQSTPGEKAKGSTDVVRSYAFAALGARRWCVPTNQIRELLKLDTEKRVLECWLYGSDVAPRNIDQYLQPGFDLATGSCLTTLGEWQEKYINLLDAQLKDINDNNKRDADTLMQIRVTSDRLVQETKSLEGDPNFAVTMNPLYEADAQQLFAVLEGNVDTVIQWRSAKAWGLQDIKALLEQVNTELPAWVNRLMAGTPMPDEDSDKGLVGQMQRREDEWPKLGWLAIHLGHKDEEMIINQGKDAKQRVLDVFTLMRKTALEKIIDLFTQKLNGLRSVVGAACKDVKSKIDHVQQSISGYEAELKTHDGEGVSASGDMYVYDAKNLDKVRDLMEKQKQKLHDQMVTTYNKLWEDTVGNVSQYTSAKLDRLCMGIGENLYETSKSLHDAVTTGETHPVLVASIMDSLLQIGGTNEETWQQKLIDKVRKFAQTVNTSVDLKPTQGLTCPRTSPQAALIIGFPEGSARTDLSRWLLENIKANIPAGTVAVDTLGIYEHSSMYEIRMLYIPFWFPARFATVTDYVYSKYRESCQDEEKKGYVSYFANLDDNDNGLASANRPPLRLDGDPDTENMLKFEVASGLKYSAESRGFAVVSRNKGGQITFLRSIDEMNVPEYTKGFDDSKVPFPDDEFTDSLDAAIELAKSTMTPEQKTAHKKQYADRLKELYDEGKSESEEYEETKAKYDLLNELLADD